jgi:hypothetical protein
VLYFMISVWVAVTSFQKDVGAFLDINNILNNKRERWYRYPMVGLNFMAGVTARF